LILLQKATTNL